MLFGIIIALVLGFSGLFYYLFMSSFSQVFGYFPYKIKTSKKIIAITFDDGPNDPYTSELLDFLKEKNIKCTFFLVGRMIQKYPDTAKRILNEGHTVANHSYSHQFRNYFKSLKFNQEIEQNQKTIENKLGVKCALYRAPWLFRHPYILKNLKSKKLIPVSGLFCHPLEVLRPSPSLIAKHAKKIAKPGRIIIFHDGKEGVGGNRRETVEALKLTVELLINDGYSFQTVDQLLNVPAYQK